MFPREIDSPYSNIIYITYSNIQAEYVKYYSFCKLSLFYHNIETYCGVYVHKRTTFTK